MSNSAGSPRSVDTFQAFCGGTAVSYGTPDQRHRAALLAPVEGLVSPGLGGDAFRVRSRLSGTAPRLFASPATGARVGCCQADPGGLDAGSAGF
jgi:hypothetical protein